MFPKDTYINRRSVLKHNLKSGLVLFPGNTESSMNVEDNVYPFRQDSSFLYYCGIDMPDIYFVMDIDNDKEIIFGDDLTPEDMVWVGAADPLGEVAEKAGIKEVRPYRELESFLKQAQDKQQHIHYLPPYRASTKLEISQFLNLSIKEVDAKKSDAFVKAVVAQRNIKTDEEIEELNKAVNITGAMHTHAMKNSKEGMTEKEMAGELQAIAVAGGGNLSFPIIYTTDGQYLHNHATEAKIKNGDLVLCDCGAETSMRYAGDMTRTFPVAERFSDLQKEVYSIVLDAHESAVSALKPGYKFMDAHMLASQKLVEGLKGMGIMKGDPKEAVQKGAHTLFFQCGLGHMMGLDMHDMENLGEQAVGYTDDLKQSDKFGFKSLRLGKALEERNVVTVEPGIYFNPFLIDSWRDQGKYTDFVNYDEVEKFKDFGGMRVEEDFVITKDGTQLLGDPVAKTPSEIEELRNS